MIAACFCAEFHDFEGMKSRLRFLVFVLVPFAVMACAADEAATVHVALIFDDGPYEHVPKLLQLLEQEHIRVTFGYVAQKVVEHPATARAVVAAGHEIVNHSYSHRHPKELDDAALEHEIVGAQNVISELAGTVPRWYWLPFGEWDDRVPALANKAHIAVYVPKTLVNSNDWKADIDANGIRHRATTGITDGTFILFHEWRLETIDQMPAILVELRRQHCGFLTFSELEQYVRGRK